MQEGFPREQESEVPSLIEQIEEVLKGFRIDGNETLTHLPAQTEQEAPRTKGDDELGSGSLRSHSLNIPPAIERRETITEL